MEFEHTPVEKDKHLPNHSKPSFSGSMLIFRGEHGFWVGTTSSSSGCFRNPWTTSQSWLFNLVFMMGFRHLVVEQNFSNRRYFKQELYTFSKAPWPPLPFLWNFHGLMMRQFQIEETFIHFHSLKLLHRLALESFLFRHVSSCQNNAVAADPKKGSWMLDVFTFQFFRNAKARKPGQTKTNTRTHPYWFWIELYL